MIIPIKGKVSYSITLDPSVWIFDDRKIVFEDAFTENAQGTNDEDTLEKAAQRWNQEVYQQKVKPPVNKSITKFEREKILVNTYVMPINDFVEHTEIQSDATEAILHHAGGETVVTLEALQTGYLLFAINGKPVKDNGPVHFYYKDGSNKDCPIKGIHTITIA
ncbi:hypothetical protein ACLIBH_03690 [Virgibacillus sp. W0430]|uniref:hypothetical protein n=1 Tax=Virgibacillus sp. W0430 TaxID=3391580 RepID=UPI003F4889FF